MSPEMRWRAGSTRAIRSKQPLVIAFCRWSQHPARRWIAMGFREKRRWTVSRPELVRDPGRLMRRLKHLGGAKQSACLLGLDFSIGVPHHYGERTGLRDFPSALEAFGSEVWSQWYEICSDRRQISLHRPFYPAGPGLHSRRDLLDGLGLVSPQQLLRSCEGKASSPPAGGGLFWMRGPCHVGHRVISGWRDLLSPSLGKFALWPFDGMLAELLAAHDLVVAEICPSACYPQLGLPEASDWSRRERPGRRAVAGPLLVWFRRHSVALADGLPEAILNGFSSVPTAEAEFDALLGLVGMIEVIDSSADDSRPADPLIQRWEGWRLGQHID